MLDKLLVSCGCSFTYGNTNDQQFIPYGDLVSIALQYTHINLSKPGASNYFIAKQVEHSLNINPNLVCIGVTTPLRFDYIENINSISGAVSYNDFNTSLAMQSSEKIESRSLLWFEKEAKNLQSTDSKRRKNLDILKFLVNYTNYDVKKNQDKFIILGSCLHLLKRNIPYIILDFDNTFDLDEENVISVNYKKLKENFPCKNDDNHFNQIGQNYISNKIIKYVETYYPSLLP